MRTARALLISPRLARGGRTLAHSFTQMAQETNRELDAPGRRQGNDSELFLSAVGRNICRKHSWSGADST